jgi:IS30 family transposase
MSRLGYEEILTIYKYISLNFTASQIAMKMRISPSTVYRIIGSNLEIKGKTLENLSYRHKDCRHLAECRKTIGQCPNVCGRFQKNICPKLLRFPFICDFCDARPLCRKERHFWNPDQVHLDRIQRLKESRKRLSLSKKALAAFDGWLTPLIRRRLSVEAIFSQHPEAFPASASTVRRWIDQGRLSARRIDLLRAVAFKAKKEYAYRRPGSKDPLAKFGHTYPHFLDYVKAHSEASIIEMDTVHGLISEELKLLTFYHRQSHLQFGVLIPDLLPASVSRVLGNLQKGLGVLFPPLFEVILADNGLEFDGLISASVHPETGEVLSDVFYTRPYNSGDKGGCERNHELFRYLVPKGRGLSDLMQEDIDFMFSMINSYPRESLNWKTPIDVFKQFFPKEILEILSLKKVPLDEISLKR